MTSHLSKSKSKSESDSEFTFLPQGALIQQFCVAGTNIVLSLPQPHQYKSHAPYFGQTIGRTTNRIANARIENLNGKTYTLAANDAPNSLHGGTKGWGQQDFSGPEPVHRNGREGVKFTYLSKDGDEGYPGTVECRVWYTAHKDPSGKTILEIEHEVEFLGDECDETVIGVTNHSYFSLNPAAPTTDGTVVTLGTNRYLELDPHSVPTGRIIPHPSAPREPNTPFTLGATGPSFDDCFVFADPVREIPLDTRPLPLRKAVRLDHPVTGLHLEVWSSEPAFQFYTGEGIEVPELEDGRGGLVPRMGGRKGVAIEPSRYVDAVREEWRGMCAVKKGEVWGARSRYVAWKEEGGK